MRVAQEYQNNAGLLGGVIPMKKFKISKLNGNFQKKEKQTISDICNLNSFNRDVFLDAREGKSKDTAGFV